MIDGAAFKNIFLEKIRGSKKNFFLFFRKLWGPFTHFQRGLIFFSAVSMGAAQGLKTYRDRAHQESQELQASYGYRKIQDVTKKQDREFIKKNQGVYEGLQNRSVFSPLSFPSAQSFLKKLGLATQIECLAFQAAPLAAISLKKSTPPDPSHFVRQGMTLDRVSLLQIRIKGDTDRNIYDFIQGMSDHFPAVVSLKNVKVKALEKGAEAWIIFEGYNGTRGDPPLEYSLEDLGPRRFYPSVVGLVNDSQNFEGIQEVLPLESGSGAPLDQKGTFYLKGVLYRNPTDWAIWINNTCITPHSPYAELTIDRVENFQVTATWHNKGMLHSFTLSPQQTYTVPP